MITATVQKREKKDVALSWTTCFLLLNTLRHRKRKKGKGGGVGPSRVLLLSSDASPLLPPFFHLPQPEAETVVLLQVFVVQHSRVKCSYPSSPVYSHNIWPGAFFVGDHVTTHREKKEFSCVTFSCQEVKRFSCGALLLLSGFIIFLLSTAHILLQCRAWSLIHTNICGLTQSQALKFLISICEPVPLSRLFLYQLLSWIHHLHRSLCYATYTHNCTHSKHW